MPISYSDISKEIKVLLVDKNQAPKLSRFSNPFDPRKSNIVLMFYNMILVSSLHSSMWRKGVQM